MGSAASISQSDQDSPFDSNLMVPSFDPNVMPKHGVVLSYIGSFISQCGGRDSLQGLTTTDVCDKYVMPWTKAQKCSLNDLLRESKHPAYRPIAEVHSLN